MIGLSLQSNLDVAVKVHSLLHRSGTTSLRSIDSELVKVKKVNSVDWAKKTENLTSFICRFKVAETGNCSLL